MNPFRLGLASGVLLVFAIAIGLGRLAGAGAGSYADWLAATATVAAFSAALVAARFAAEAVRAARDALHIEQRRDQHRDEQALRAQAELVAAWVEDLDGQMVRPGDVPYHVTEQEGQSITVRNASELPVTRVGLAFTLHVATHTQEGLQITNTEIGLQELPIVPPGTKNVDMGLDILVAFQRLWDEAQSATTRRLRVGITFVDAGGRAWIREDDGRLLESPDVLTQRRRQLP
jgi:hypothetical protein